MLGRPVARTTRTTVAINCALASPARTRRTAAFVALAGRSRTAAGVFAHRAGGTDIAVEVVAEAIAATLVVAGAWSSKRYTAFMRVNITDAVAATLIVFGARRRSPCWQTTALGRLITDTAGTAMPVE